MFSVGVIEVARFEQVGSAERMTFHILWGSFWFSLSLVVKYNFFDKALILVNLFRYFLKKDLWFESPFR